MMQLRLQKPLQLPSALLTESAKSQAGRRLEKEAPHRESLRGLAWVKWVSWVSAQRLCHCCQHSLYAREAGSPSRRKREEGERRRPLPCYRHLSIVVRVDGQTLTHLDRSIVDAGVPMVLCGAKDGPRRLRPVYEQCLVAERRLPPVASDH